LAVADAISRAGAAVGALLIVVVLAVTTVGVFSRYVLARPILGVDEGTGFLVVAIVMLGAAEALRRGDHIRIDLLLDVAGPRLRRMLELWSYAAVLLFAVLLFRTAWHTVTFSHSFGAYSDGYLALPLWIPQSALPVGAVLLGLQALAGLIRQLAGR
jgi:TRAP-type C4-dicarboxylate transport system permease small subunit